MIRNKCKYVDSVTTIPVIVDGKEIGKVTFDMLYHEMKFHLDVDKDEMAKFMKAFDKTGMAGFAITYRPGGTE